MREPLHGLALVEAPGQTRLVVTFYVFLLIVGAVGALAYVFLFFSHVPGAKDERLGKLEPLPDEMSQWVELGAHDGLVKEERRLFADPGEMDQTKILVQTRYRDPETKEIVRVDPERTYRRKRIRS